jgi:hypothetical protein
MSPSRMSRHSPEATFTTWVKEPPGGLRTAVGLGLGLGDLGGAEVRDGEGDAEVADGDGEDEGEAAEADGATGTVAVTVTAGGPDGAATEPAVSVAGVVPGAGSR